MDLQPKQLRKYLRSCDSDVKLVLCERLHNVLLGQVRMKVRDLENYRHIFEGVSKKKSSTENDEHFTHKNRFPTDSNHY